MQKLLKLLVNETVIDNNHNIYNNTVPIKNTELLRIYYLQTIVKNIHIYIHASLNFPIYMDSYPNIQISYHPPDIQIMKTITYCFYHSINPAGFPIITSIEAWVKQKEEEISVNLVGLVK